MINAQGQFFTKPEGYNPTPTISHTIMPVKAIEFNLWNECVRAQLETHAPNKLNPVGELKLVKKYDLKDK